MHPLYDDYEIRYDIALVELSKPIQVAEYQHIRPICLPANGLPKPGAPVTVTGWGDTSEGALAYSSQLREVG